MTIYLMEEPKFERTIRAVRHRNQGTAIEVLVPDFKGNFENLDIVLDAIQTSSTIIWKRLRDFKNPHKTASYQRSIDVLNHAREKGFKIKSGIMLGLGEKQDEIRTTAQDLVNRIKCSYSWTVLTAKCRICSH